MNYEAISAVGTVFGAIATSTASVIALYLGLRKPKKNLSISTHFYEKSCVIAQVIEPRFLILASDLNDEDSNPLLLGFNVRNSCAEDIALIGFSECARFNHAIKTMSKRLSKVRKKKYSSLTKDGFISLDMRFGEMCYLFDRPVLIKPNERQLLAIDCDCIKRTQIDREKSELFNLKEPLSFFAIDIEGNRYKVSSKIPAENFYVEKTCRLNKRHWLD
ncbi:MAG: hypothetical protein PUD81_03840 [Eggerthellales bacterium]|nr:hypothetical protein [Eggerthellales bacterium]